MTSTQPAIPGGYILLSRKILDSDLMDKPGHFLKLWIWMLSKAFWKDGHEYKRGQLITSITEMQDVGMYQRGGHMVGRLTKDQVRSAYGYFAKAGMITIANPTKKILISIINFDSYQNPTNYETHKKANPATDPATNPTIKTPQLPAIISSLSNTPESEPHNGPRSGHHPYIEKKVKEVKTSCASPPVKRPPSGDHQTFISWWCYAYEITQGKPYLVTGKEFRPVKELLAAHTLKPLMVMACWFLTCKDAWLASKRDITMFKSQINRIPGDKSPEHNAADYRAAGILPPEGTMLEEWHFWNQHGQQETLAL